MMSHTLHKERALVTSLFIFYLPSQHTWGIHPLLFQCLASVEDGGPTLKHSWVNALVCWICEDNDVTQRVKKVIIIVFGRKS